MSILYLPLPLHIPGGLSQIYHIFSDLQPYSFIKTPYFMPFFLCLYLSDPHTIRHMVAHWRRQYFGIYDFHFGVNILSALKMYGSGSVTISLVRNYDNIVYNMV